MEVINLLQVNLFPFLTLLILFLNMKKSSRNILFDQKIFLKLTAFTLLMLSLDMLKILIVGETSLDLINLNYLISTLILVLTPIPALLWTFYADYKIYEDTSRIDEKVWLAIIPIIINTTLIIMNLTSGPLKGMIFQINKNNIYSRGPYFVIVLVITYAYLFFTLIHIIKNQKKISEKIYIPLITFIIPPTIGGLIQYFYPFIRVIWLGLSLSIVIIYISIQNTKLYIDPLTGLFNRRKMNMYLENILKDNKNKIIGGIMIDLDDFKSINDTFGHREGDRALSHVSNILKENFRKDDFIARYAGDEFLVILKINQVSELQAIVDRLKTNIENFNNKNLTPYRIQLSIGYDVFYADSPLTSEWFVNHVDKLMYQQKESKKLIKA